MLVHIEGNRADSGVSAASVAFADLGQVDYRFFRRPRVRSHRNLYPEAALTQADAINGFRMKEIGNELVVTLEIQVGDLVCALKGCEFPVILRREGEGFTFVGTCDVQGLVVEGVLDGLLEGAPILEVFNLY